MSYSLNDFCDDARAILSERDDHDGRDQVRRKLELLLVDPAFKAEYLAPDDQSGVKQIYQDPELNFCVLTYNMQAPRTSPPHDHGNSWAVYGQANGHTDMTLWSGDESAAGETAVKPVRTFRLEPGQAGLFDVREIHSIDYAEGAKFVRVTGVDLGNESRRVFDPETGAVREIEDVGAGSTRPSKGA
jgi:predicted metal-dependent enzyme (double-stranded beta helix superfamily)